MRLFTLFLVLVLLIAGNCETDNTFMPTKCEICALVSIEFDSQAARVHRRNCISYSGRFQRVSSEFADITEKICLGFNEFKIHKEKSGLERFSRAPSKTIETLKQMRDKGVKVELGMPYEMWDQPSAEIFALRQGCESLLEDYEDVIEEWFLKKLRVDNLFKQLCVKSALKNGDASCFSKVSEDKEL